MMGNRNSGMFGHLLCGERGEVSSWAKHMNRAERAVFALILAHMASLPTLG